MHKSFYFNLFWRDLLSQHLIFRHRRQLIKLPHQARHHPLVKPCLDRPLAQRPYISQPHAIGGQHPGKGMHQNDIHPQNISNQTGMLPPRTAKTLQRIIGHIIAPLYRDFLDRVRHILNGDPQKPVGNLLGAAGSTGRCRDLGGKAGEFLAHHLCIQLFILVRAKYRGKEIWLQLAKHHIAIGHRQRAAAPVTGWSRIGPRTLRANAKPRPVKLAQRATTRSHRMDQQHRRMDPHPGNQCLEHPLIGIVIMRHVG